ncbi:DUF5959 family protein [Streptomyces sp. NPDC091376]|uniref:DUF5959 family protein n=1 Tax=Streptomyces sp. NPDC091376 TaxID=3365994 RepID=UPI00381B6F9D
MRGSGGWNWTRRRPTGRQACEASGGAGSLGRKPIYQGLHHVVSPTAARSNQVGKGSMSLTTVTVTVPLVDAWFDDAYRRLDLVWETWPMTED